MNRPWEADHEPQREPSPEQLAAYFDGELPPGERAWVDAWLADHPEGRAEVEALRHLHAQYDSTAAPEPEPAAWDRTLARVEADLDRKRRRQRGWLWGLGGLVAAALLGVLLLPRDTAVPEDTEPFPVVAPGDVRILSMNPDDHGTLVGVRPLLLDRIDLATHDDIEVVADNNNGILRIDDWASPMIVDPQSYPGRR